MRGRNLHLAENDSGRIASQSEEERLEDEEEEHAEEEEEMDDEGEHDEDDEEDEHEVDEEEVEPEDEDDEETIYNVHKRIYNILSEIHRGKWLPSGRAPAFAYSKRFKNSVPTPDIKISGLGSVVLPLTANQLHKITSSPHCEVAPFGHGEITKVDESVRTTRQIDSNYFAIQNNKFQEWLSGIVDKVKQELGIVARTVEAQP